MTLPDTQSSPKAASLNWKYSKIMCATYATATQEQFHYARCGRVLLLVDKQNVVILESLPGASVRRAANARRVHCMGVLKVHVFAEKLIAEGG